MSWAVTAVGPSQVLNPNSAATGLGLPTFLQKARGMFYCMQQSTAQDKLSLLRSLGSSGIWLSSHCSVPIHNTHLIKLHFCLPIFQSTLCSLDYSKRKPNSVKTLIMCDLIYPNASKLAALFLPISAFAFY